MRPDPLEIGGGPGHGRACEITVLSDLPDRDLGFETPLVGQQVVELAGGLLYYFMGEAWAIPAVIVFVVVFALSYYFIEDLIGVITALIGSIICGAAIYLIFYYSNGTEAPMIALLAGIVIFIMGAAVQTYVLD